MRTFRNRTTVLAAATTAALALTLTACGDNGTGTRSEGSAASDSATVAAETPKAADDAAETGTAGSTGSGTGTAQAAGTTKSAGGSGDSAGTSAKASAPLCTAEGLQITAERQDGPPYTHLTLSAKNTSGAGCEMKEYPHIHFLDNARGIVPPVAKSKPQTPVILEPGQSAYVAVRMSEGGRKESTETVKEFTVTLKANGGGMAVVKSPAPEGLSVNPQKWATGYWTTELRNGADDF
ncbi:hypothetical protein ASD97_08340 [Streptomyces sp. Root63]|uniref:DUF4232 domain-containing protein n=1 Tax=unclassified Streptomyces TaxID=2593676 RepID=UPI0006F7F3AB|nr:MULTISPECIES: DUF4232 domain-containing protein [unclassified Streptomyces]KQX37287.1 hypothetical protein ASD29_08890 [Streptomyces sp. Root1295]KRA43645.1 hypothetical protein ASD97_08340 [Streptomyces sp. Root63]